MVQVCVHTGGDAAFPHRLSWDMPISGVKRARSWRSRLSTLQIAKAERQWSLSFSSARSHWALM